MRTRSIVVGVMIAAQSAVLATDSGASPPGQLAVNVERLFGVSRVSSEARVGGSQVENTATSISLLGSPFFGPAYSSPRLALDYLHGSGLSVGVGLGYQQVDLEIEIPGEAGSTDSTDVSVLVVAPRAGYFARVTPEFGLWPRAGVTHRSVGGESAGDATLTALTLELPLVYLAAAGHVGLFAMPHLDFGVAGEVGTGSDAVEQTATEVGLQFGLSAFF
jgi:hypothetical protein